MKLYAGVSLGKLSSLTAGDEGFTSNKLWPRFQSFLKMEYALAANPTMTIAVVDKIAKTTKSKPFNVFFSFN